jgi:hypothetical protein
MEKEKRHLIDFIREAKKSKRLTKEIMQIKDAKQLKAFFAKEGYDKITAAECEKVLHFKRYMPRDIKQMVNDKGAY